MTVYAYIIITVLGVCLVAALIYAGTLMSRISKLNEYIKWLDARTKPATEMIAVRHSIDTYAMAKQYRFDYLNQILEVMIRKLANEITRRLHDRLYTELRKRKLSHICIQYLEINLETFKLKIYLTALKFFIKFEKKILKFFSRFYKRKGANKIYLQDLGFKINIYYFPKKPRPNSRTSEISAPRLRSSIIR